MALSLTTSQGDQLNVMQLVLRDESDAAVQNVCQPSFSSLYGLQLLAGAGLSARQPVPARRKAISAKVKTVGCMQGGICL